MSTSKTFRLFISSTFVDFVEERNILQNEVFPEIKNFCRSHGYSFEPIDLRWGVTQEDGLDHKAMEICINEVKKAFNYPKPNFLAMLGNRYGWIPAPTEIVSINYLKLIGKTSQSEKDLLNKWYKEDLNTIPNKYILQPINYIEQDKSKYDEVWRDAELKIIDIIKRYKDVFPDESLVGKSATEQEIVKGIIEPSKAISTNDSKVLCLVRNITNVDDITDNLFVDKDQTQINNLKNKIEILKDDNVVYKKFNTILKKRDDNTYKPEGDYLDDYAIVVKIFLKEHISKEIQRLANVSKDLEDKIHNNFKKDRIKTFIGRDKIVSKALEYVTSNVASSPFVVYGESGVGKSALIAKIIQNIEDNFNEKYQLLFRFIGISEQSSQPKLLIESLIVELENILGVSSKNKYNNYAKVVDYFLELLNKCAVNEDIKYIIVLDALDQFVSKTNLEWIENKLPQNIKIILSTLPSEYGEYLKILYTKVEPRNIIKVEILNLGDGKKILSEWLSSRGRTLQKNQEEYILSKFKNNGLPLYLKIIFEKSVSWKSYDKDFKTLEDATLMGAIKRFFSDLHEVQHHPTMLIRHTLGYLSASKNGLSESEIVEILSLDYIVIGDISNPHYRLPTRSNIDKVPAAIWSRLYYDLVKYLTYVEFDNLSLLNFYHRKIKECSSMFYYQLDKEYYHSNLLEYFWNQPLYFTETKEVNLRKLSELPYHCIQSNAYSKFLQLNNKEFVDKKLQANQLDDLLLEYYDISSNISNTDVEKEFKDTFLNELALNLLDNLINNKETLLNIEVLHATYVYRKDKTIYNAILEIACDLNSLSEKFEKNKEILKFYYVAFNARKANMIRREGKLKEAKEIYENIFTKNMIGILDKGEQSRIYYDMGYILYLSGEYDSAIEFMTKSSEIADTKVTQVSKYISKCLAARIEFLYNGNVDNFEKVLNEAYFIFDENKLVNLGAKRWIKNVYAHLFEVYYAKHDLKNMKKYYALLKSDDWMITHQDIGNYSSFTPYEARIKILEKDFLNSALLFEKYIYEVISNEDRNTRESMARDYYDYLLSLKEVDTNKFLEEKKIALELHDEPGNHIWKQKIKEL